MIDVQAAGKLQAAIDQARANAKVFDSLTDAQLLAELEAIPAVVDIQTSGRYRVATVWVGGQEFKYEADTDRQTLQMAVHGQRLRAKKSQQTEAAGIHIQRTIRVTCNGNAVEYTFGSGDKVITERNLGGDLKRLSTDDLKAFFAATLAAQREVLGGAK